MESRRFPATLAGSLDDPARLEWLPPARVIAALDIQTGETAADVGAGTGYFTLPLAQAVGPQGKVYAIDGQSEMLALLGKKLDAHALGNIERVHAEANRTGLPAASCDLWLLANLWHEIDDCSAVVREARRALKPGGIIAILDWRPDVEPVAGPPAHHRLPSLHAIGYLCAEGFEEVTQSTVGKYSWLVLGRTP